MLTRLCVHWQCWWLCSVARQHCKVSHARRRQLMLPLASGADRKQSYVVCRGMIHFQSHQNGKCCSKQRMLKVQKCSRRGKNTELCAMAQMRTYTNDDCRVKAVDGKCVRTARTSFAFLFTLLSLHAAPNIRLTPPASLAIPARCLTARSSEPLDEDLSITSS